MSSDSDRIPIIHDRFVGVETSDDRFDPYFAVAYLNVSGLRRHVVFAPHGALALYQELRKALKESTLAHLIEDV